MRSIFIKRAHLKEILTKARESKVEVCGFLIGTMKGEDAFVDYVVFAENRLNSPVGFEIDPLETLRVLEKAEEEGKEVIGIFHSHLNCSPYPSHRDLKGMDLWRNVWLIVNNTGEYRAFVLENGQIKEINVGVT